MELNWFTLFTWMDLVEKIDIKDIPTDMDLLRKTFPDQVERCRDYIAAKTLQYGSLIE